MGAVKEYQAYCKVSPVHGFVIEDLEEQILKFKLVNARRLMYVDIALIDKGYQLYGIKKHNNIA